jgi:hypothetical protein
MRVVLALVLFGCGPHSSGSFVGTAQQCTFRTESSGPVLIDVLFVIDDSPAMASVQQRLHDEVARIVDEQLSYDRSREPLAWYHFGAITADPADAAKLHGGCGIADDRRFVEYRRGLLDNLEPTTDVGAAIGCLAARGSAGSATQQPMTMAAAALTTDIVENRTFRRDGAILAVVFVLATDYSDDGAALLDAGPANPNDFILASVSPLSTHLDPVVASVPTHVQLPPDATDWSALFAWDKGWLDGDGFRPCLPDAPRDPAHPDFVVEDISLSNGVVTEIQSCTASDWMPSCWDLRPDGTCLTGLLFEVQRPLEGPPRDTITRVAYDCALRWR